MCCVVSFTTRFQGTASNGQARLSNVCAAMPGIAYEPGGYQALVNVIMSSYGNDMGVHVVVATSTKHGVYRAWEFQDKLALAVEHDPFMSEVCLLDYV